MSQPVDTVSPAFSPDAAPSDPMVPVALPLPVTPAPLLLAPLIRQFVSHLSAMPDGHVPVDQSVAVVHSLVFFLRATHPHDFPAFMLSEIQALDAFRLRMSEDESEYAMDMLLEAYGTARSLLPLACPAWTLAHAFVESDD